MAITLYDVITPNDKAYIYDENKELIMTFEMGSSAHNQFITAAQEHGDLVIVIDSYGQAVERLNKEIADERYTQAEEITFKKYAKYAIIGIGILLIINFLRK